jgi:hypothetical protein
VDYSDVFLLFGRKLGVSLTGAYQEVGDGLQAVRTTFAGNWNYSSPTVGRQVLYADQEYHLNRRVNLQAKFDYRLSNESSVMVSAGWTRFVNIMDQVRPQYTDNLIFDAAQSTTDFWVFTRSTASRRRRAATTRTASPTIAARAKNFPPSRSTARSPRPTIRSRTCFRSRWPAPMKTRPTSSRAPSSMRRGTSRPGGFR